MKLHSLVLGVYAFIYERSHFVDIPTWTRIWSEEGALYLEVDGGWSGLEYGVRYMVDEDWMFKVHREVSPPEK